MRKLDALFYIMLGILTLAVLIMLGLWIRTRYSVYLYLMLGAFAAYSFHIILTLIRGGKDLRGSEAFRSKFLMLLNHVDSKIVYITYLGTEKRILKPSCHKNDYLIEFYEPDTDLELLKKHIWFELSEADEKKLKKKFIGGMDVPFSYLDEIRSRKVLIQEEFYQFAANLSQFSEFFANNEIISYGD